MFLWNEHWKCHMESKNIDACIIINGLFCRDLPIYYLMEYGTHRLLVAVYRFWQTKGTHLHHMYHKRFFVYGALWPNFIFVIIDYELLQLWNFTVMDYCAYELLRCSCTDLKVRPFVVFEACCLLSLGFVTTICTCAHVFWTLRWGPIWCYFMDIYVICIVVIHGVRRRHIWILEFDRTCTHVFGWSIHMGSHIMH